MQNLSKKDLLSITFWILPLALALSLMLGLHMAPHRVEPLVGLNSDNDGVVAHHFLSLKCNCSRNLIKHLKTRRAQSGVREIVHLIYSRVEVQADLERAGFEVSPLSEEAAVQLFNLKDLPQLVVLNKDKKLYQGGYGPDQQHTQIYEDQQILAQALKQQSSEEYPVFGCANGKIQKENFDLLGVKYGYNP